MVPTKDVAWHAGNWYVNTHSVGIENEGFALQGAQWFTPKLYRSLARLTRYQAKRFGFPLNRAHVIGHDQVPGPSSPYQAGMHWDPGPFFDWARFMALVGAPIGRMGLAGTDPIVSIDPKWRTNEPTVTGCGDGTATCPKQPTSFVYLHTAPSQGSPLVSDPYLTAAGVEPDGVGTTLRLGLGRQGLDRGAVRRRRPTAATGSRSGSVVRRRGYVARGGSSTRPSRAAAP